MSPRDKWLVIVLPAIIILLLGWLVVLRPIQKDLGLLRERVANNDSLEDHQCRAAAAMAGAVAREDEATRLEQALGGAPVFDGNRTMARLSDLCRKHGLSLLETKPENSMDKLSVSLKKLGESTAPHATGRVWKVELAGPYAGMVAMLDGLANGQSLAVPLSVTMRPATAPRRPALWTLYIWL